MYRVWTLLCVLSTLWLGTAAQNGVFMMFMGRIVLTNGTGVICVSDIGAASATDSNDTGDALVCVTNNTTCCRVDDGASGNGVGQWEINGELVNGRGSALGLSEQVQVVRDRGTRLVRLNVKANHTTMVVGDYCCEIPDSMGITQRLCVSGRNDDTVCSSTTTPLNSEPIDATTSQPGNDDTPTSPPPPPPPPAPTAAIAGGVIVGLLVAIVLIVLIIILYCVLVKRKKTSYTQTEQLQNVVLEDSNKGDSLKSQGTADTPLNGHEGVVYDDVVRPKPDQAHVNTSEAKNGRARYKSIDRSKMDRSDSYTDMSKLDTAHYEDVDRNDEQMDSDMYSVPDKKPSVGKKPSVSANLRPPSTRGSSTEPLSEAELSDMYAVPDKKPSKAKKPSITTRSSSSRGSSVGPTDAEVGGMYAVPDKVSRTYVNQTSSREGSAGPAAGGEYAEISDSPAVPKKSAQLEEYLETKPVGGSSNEYATVEDATRRPKANTLQALKKPLNNTAMSENPLYDMSAVRRTHTVSNPQQVHSDNVYAEPNAPAPQILRQDKDTERIYETIYSESIQPASFASSPAPTEPGDEELCPYSSIYTLPTSPLPAEEKPLIVLPENIETVQNLGTGNFGMVVLAKTVGLSMKQLKMSKVDDDKNVKIYVAVKMLKEKASSTMREAFEKEYKFMSRLNHPSVIRLLGIHMGEAPFIMMEYMEKGDLNQYLKNFETIVSGLTHSRKCMSTGTLVNICTQIASGMEYLAHQNFVHRDLATRNCLVGQNNVVKIADFGMSRNLYESHYYIIKGHAILPIRWMSTECFYGKFSAKSDVWAFGVTMWEIFTLCKDEPYTGMSDGDLVEDAVKGAKRTLLTRPGACPVDVFRVMEECWIYEPHERATFEDVFAQLSSLNFKYSSH